MAFQGLPQLRPIDPILTQFGLEYRQAQDIYTADAVFPFVQTTGWTGTYYEAEALNNLRAENAAWSLYGGASRIDMRFTAKAFRAQPYSFELPVSDFDVDNWLAGGADLRARASQAITDKLLLAREVRVEAVLDAVAPTTSLGGGGVKWDSTASNPRADVRTGQATVLKRIGKLANNVVITGLVWDSILGTVATGSAGAAIIDAVKYTSPGFGNKLTPELVASYLNIDKVIPAVAIQQDPASHETTTVASGGLPQAGLYVYDQKELYIFYADPSPGPQTVAFGITFGPSLLEFDSYREDKTKSDVVRGFSIVQEATTCANALYVLGTVIA